MPTDDTQSNPNSASVLSPVQPPQTDISPAPIPENNPPINPPWSGFQPISQTQDLPQSEPNTVLPVSPEPTQDINETPAPLEPPILSPIPDNPNIQVPPSLNEPTTPPEPVQTPLSGVVQPEFNKSGEVNPEQPSQPESTPPKKNNLVNVLLILGGFIVLILLILVGVKFGLPLVQRNQSITLTWWGLWEDESVVKPLIEEYEKNNPRVKIAYTMSSQQDYRERLVNALAKGNGPDIFRFHNTWTPMFRSQLGVLPETVMSADEYAKTFYPIMVSDLTTNSGIVGIPLMYEGLALYINETIFSNNGLTPPRTWDDLRAIARDPRLTKKDEQGILTSSAIALGETENIDHWQEVLALMMIQNGTNMLQPADELGKGALSFYSRFSSVDNVWDTSLPHSTVAFASGKVAMYFGPSWRYFEIKQKNPSLKFRTIPLPQLPKDTPDQPDISYATYWVEGVWSRSKNATEAWKFLRFLSSKESLEKMYTNASKIRDFGEPYPRPDMASLLKDNPILGPIISQAPYARSWYLADRTFDGPTGINSQINKYYLDAVNSVTKGGDAGSALTTAQNGVTQVLGQYGAR